MGQVDDGCSACGETSHFRHLNSNWSEGKARFIQKFCMREIERVMEEHEIGAKQAVRELVERWQKEGRRPATDNRREKLGILKPKMKEGLNKIGTHTLKKVRFCLDSGDG